MHPGALVHVVESSDYTEHRRGINSFTQSFVVKADVAAGDGNLKLLTGFSDAVDGLRELPHDVRLFGIAEVEAVGRGQRSCSRTGDLARCLGNGVHRTEARIEIAPASIAVESHGQS